MGTFAVDGPAVLQFQDGVRFPPLCAACAAAASRRLSIGKNFGSSSEPNIFVLQPYFCDACIAAHRREIPVVPLSTQVWRLLGTWYTIPAIASLVLMLKFVVDMTAAAVAGEKNRVIFAGICLTFFACILAWSMLKIRQRAHPYLLQPSTSITSAFQFTHDLSETFEPTWRRYTLRNPAYAQAFAEWNRNLAWDRYNPKAVRARSLRFYGTWLAAVVLGAAGLYALYDDYLRPIWEAIRDALNR